MTTYVKVTDGAVTRTGLPTNGTLANGRWVLGYNLLPTKTLKAEGWLPYTEQLPVFDPMTEHITRDHYNITATKVTGVFVVVADSVTDWTQHAPTDDARLTAVESILLGTVMPSGDNPTFEALTTRQNQIIYAGQTFTFEGDDWQAVVGPLNSNATPATYPIGYTKLTGASVPDAWAVGTAYKVSDRVTYKGHLYTCLTAHTATESWTPTAAPSLWRDDGAVS